MERSGEISWKMGLPASVTRKILPRTVETRIAVFAIVTNLRPRMSYTVDTSPVVYV